MLNLFLRTILLYLFLLLVLRLTGKRQVADLEPSDLIVTLVIADVGSNAISDPNIPLLYSVVPILGLYLTQQLIAKACLKSDRIRGFVCGTPQYLIKNGVLQEKTLRDTNYAVRDLIEHLREKDVFDPSEVTDAILETNGSLSVRLRPDGVPPTRADCSVPIPNEQRPALLIRDGKLCEDGLKDADLSRQAFSNRLKKNGLMPKDLYYAQRGADGSIRVQTFARSGAKVSSLKKEG